MKSILAKKNGFTIMELIITLSLLGIVLAVIYALFFYVQSSFNNANAHLNINQQLNMAYMQMEQDIRSAMKPNYLTDAIIISDDREMHIYTYDEAKNKYIRIAYRLDFSKNAVLERGLAICSDNIPPADENPEYGTITDWETLIDGVIERYNGKKSGFTLMSAASPTEYLKPTPTPIVRKTINITLIVNDPDNPMNEPVISEKVLTSRSNSNPK